ncbi:MAG: hypothetical protein GTO02_03555, partial [Candidatus Dadabacteria bacterium]|nr:hypothetical protein [Candidatus Dadabacteria bacterium]
TTDEIFEVNQIVVESARKRAITIVTTPSFGPTSQAIEYARHAQNIQADLILALYPDRYYGDQCIYEFFKSISDNCEIPVMIHEMPM